MIKQKNTNNKNTVKIVDSVIQYQPKQARQCSSKGIMISRDYLVCVFFFNTYFPFYY